MTSGAGGIRIEDQSMANQAYSGRYSVTDVNPDSPVIVVTSDGLNITYVRWYADVWSAERNHVMLMVTATGTSVHTKYLEDIPESWFGKAREVKAILADDAYADLNKFATHKHSVTSNGPLVPME